MKKKLMVMVIGAVLAMGTAFADDWSIEADYSESCSCNPACPCMFGSAPTNEHCEGSRLVEINDGSFNGVDLDGVKVMMTFRMGAWVKYSVDGEENQVDAARDLVMAAFPGFASWGVASTEQARIKVEKTADTVSFSVPDAGVDIELMRGKGDKPIRVENLLSADNYVQYVSKKNMHDNEKDGFKYSGTNGFTATVKAEGSDPE